MCESVGYDNSFIVGGGSRPHNFHMETLLLLSLLTRPINGPITQYPSKTHPAVDIACFVGDPVRAAHLGRLHFRRSASLGNVIEIEGDGYRSLYAHLDTVKATGTVEQGQIIATCGNTGRDTTGPHLHFAVKRLPNL